MNELLETAAIGCSSLLFLGTVFGFVWFMRTIRAKERQALAELSRTVEKGETNE